MPPATGEENDEAVFPDIDPEHDGVKVQIICKNMLQNRKNV